MKFVIYNASGEILKVGACPDGEEALQCPAGAFMLIGEADPLTDSVEVETQTVIAGGRPQPPPDVPMYVDARAAAYPPLAEQLDMLWSAMDADPSKRLEPFYSRIKAIKAAYPKDNSVPPGSAVIYTMESV